MKHNCKQIKVKEKGIYGVNNPQLIIKLCGIKDLDFILEFDEEEISDYDIINLGDDDVVLQTPVPDRVKNIILETKENVVLCKMKNYLFFRLVNKSFGIVKKIISNIKLFFYILYKGIRLMWKRYHFLVPPKLIKKYICDFKNIWNGSNMNFYNPYDRVEYNKWLKKNQTNELVQTFEYNPLISLLLPVYNVDSKYLSECLDSVLVQTYENFEVCLVDDCSTKPSTIETIKAYQEKDDRIKVKFRKKNGHISRATNDALKMAKGEFIALIDNDDLLTRNALYENVKVLNENKNIDFIYSDEDKISSNGVFCEPHFKPNFSPDTLLSLNYICHFSVIRKSLVEKVGGFEIGLEGAQDYDLFLKVTEKTQNIYHIPKILYHWRMIPGSTASSIENKDYALDKGVIAIQNALDRRKINGKVVKDEISNYYKVVYDVSSEPLISIIIPTRDYVSILKKCVDSIYEKTKYKNFEIIIANNDSKKKETLEFFKEYQNKHDNFKVVDCIMEFNYSKINNIAVKASKGDYIVLLNNDTEVITPEWLDIMLGYAMQKHIGTVGVKLLYPDDLTIQHCGVVLGLGGVASHAFLGYDGDKTGIFGKLRVPYDYAANTAACLMINKKKFLEVEGLDEDLRVAYNDIDLNVKLLVKGYYNVCLPQVELLHYESKSRGLDTTSEKYERFLLESQYMWNKWGDLLKNDPFYNSNFSLKAFMLLDKNKHQ